VYRQPSHMRNKAAIVAVEANPDAPAFECRAGPSHLPLPHHTRPRDARPSFIVSTGDNFYPHGLKGPNDTQFRRTFMEVYTQSPLQVRTQAGTCQHT